MKCRRSLDGGRLIKIAAHAARRREWTIERADYVGDHDLAGWTGQAEPAIGAPSGDDEAGRSEFAQDLFEERRGNRKPLVDLRAFAPCRITLADGEQGQRGVFGRDGHAHGAF